jgi:hypothetical protein
MIQQKLLKPWPLRLFLKKISGFVITITGVLIVILSGLSYYGNSVGDMVVSIDNIINRSLSLSETGGFAASDASTMLAARGINDIRDSTFYYIPEDIHEGEGLKSDKKGNMYFAYTFFLKNASDVSVSYSATISIDRQTKNIDKAVRIMIIVDNEDPVIYARPRSDGTPETLEDNESAIKKGYSTVPFTENEFSAINQKVMEIDQIQKYTVVIWIEGWDADCTDAIVGGNLEISMTFKIIEGDE